MNGKENVERLADPIIKYKTKQMAAIICHFHIIALGAHFSLLIVPPNGKVIIIDLWIKEKNKKIKKYAKIQIG